MWRVGKLEVVRSSWWPCSQNWATAAVTDTKAAAVASEAAYSHSDCHSGGQSISRSYSHSNVTNDNLSGDHKNCHGRSNGLK